MSNYQRVGQGNIKFVKYAESKPGQVLAEGTYLTTKEGTYGPQHHFRTDLGDTVVLNSSGILNKRLADHVSRGDQVRITYNGKTTLAAGKFKGKEAHDFIVEVDSTRSSRLPAEEEDEYTAPAPAASLASVEDEEDAAPTPHAVPTSSATKPSAQDILAKYRKKA